MSYGALGLVEVLGSCNAVVVLDPVSYTHLDVYKRQAQDMQSMIYEESIQRRSNNINLQKV